MLTDAVPLTQLAFAANAGLTILCKPSGFRALCAVGEAVVREWRNLLEPFYFEGDARQMSVYVNTFLQAVRADFPRLFVQDIAGAGAIAETRRIPVGARMNGNLSQLNPKGLGGIYFNRQVC